jgi:hypothetical protein
MVHVLLIGGRVQEALVQSGSCFFVQLQAQSKGKPKKIDLLDTMLSSLVDVLIEKGIITEEEYEKRIKEKVKVK